MAHATRVAKGIINSGENGVEKKIVGYQIAATAPDAFEAQNRIMTIAMSETGKPPLPPKPEDPLKPVPSQGSPLALRENHRIIRSKPGYHLRTPRDPWTESEESKNGTRDFMEWNPAPLIKGTKMGENAALADEEEKAPAEKIKAKAHAMVAYAKKVDEIIAYGVETSSGSGHTLPVPSLTAKTLENVIKLVPSKKGFLEDQHLQQVLGDEVRSVQREYGQFAARASLNYQIRDGWIANSMGIDTESLTDESVTDLWTQKEYKLKRVSRVQGLWCEPQKSG